MPAVHGVLFSPPTQHEPPNRAIPPSPTSDRAQASELPPPWKEAWRQRTGSLGSCVDARMSFCFRHVGGVMKPSHCESCTFCSQEGNPTHTPSPYHLWSMPEVVEMHGYGSQNTSPLLFTNWYSEESILSVRFKRQDVLYPSSSILSSLAWRKLR